MYVSLQTKAVLAFQPVQAITFPVTGVLNIGGLSLDIEYIFTDFYCYVHTHVITFPL